MQSTMIDDAQGAKQFRNSIVADISALPRPSTDRIDQKPVPGKATDCSPQIVITVTPDQRPGRYRTHIETEPKPLSVSRQPFLDGARELLARGHDPKTMLVMRWVGAEDWAVRGSLGLAAKLTVDEHNGVFAKWKPYSRSAVPPRSANSTRTAPNGRAGKKPILESTAEKAGERTGLGSRRHYV